MPKEAVFTMKLESELRDQFMAEAEAAHRPASQLVRELMREFIQRQRQAREYDEFLQHKVEAARTSMRAGHGRSNDEVEAKLPPGAPRPQATGEGCLDTRSRARPRRHLGNHCGRQSVGRGAEAAAKLEDFPLLGHAGMILGTRELIPHASYRLVYETAIDENTVWVLALVHTARHWPPVRD